MSLASGTRLGGYEIVAPLGAGGMGEVYRARDTKLNRDVAIKLLPDAFTRDPERVVRFQREAQLLAALNHPHIGAIYGLEESDGVPLLVLELIDGGTLAERLAQGPIPLGESLSIARQIVDALEAAHEKGIIHRDLKPANIALTGDNQVKVLDFGLAKALDTEARPDLSHSPTLTFAATQAGVILGTAAYMAPEQAKGRVADKRSDVWAFGCVLFEMLAGKRTFEGEDVSDTLAAILRGEPDWTALPAATPSHVRTLIRRCLEKDRKKRISDVGVVRYVLDEAASEPTATPAAAEGTRRRLHPAVVAAATAAATLGLGAAYLWVTRPLRAQPAVTRFTFVPPPAQALMPQPADRNLAITPDGSRVVYRTGGPGSQSQLSVRALNELDAHALQTGEARSPFVSADGQWVAFFAIQEIKKMPLAGGPAIPICRFTGAPRGGTWAPDDTIVFATGEPRTGLFSVPASGGQAKPITTPGADGDHLFPSMLPGGRGVLFSIVAPAATPESSQVAVLDLTTGRTKTLIRGGSYAEYVDGGFLVYAAAGTLRGVRFDLDRLTVQSDPVPVIEQVLMPTSGAANVAVSRTGTLVYVPGGDIAAQAAIPRSLVWVDRQGREQPIKAPSRSYSVARLSPDGSRIALDIRDQQQDIWIWDITRETLTRLTFDPLVDMCPVWSADGRRVIWASVREASLPNLYWQAADGTGAVERLTSEPTPQFPTSVSPDGSRLAFFANMSGGAQDLATIDLRSPDGGIRHPEPLVHTTAAELDPDFSPDGRWIAYQSNESSRFEVYVRPFPKVDSGRWQVSTAGGTRPVWGHDGRELLYLDLNGYLTSVPVQMTADTFRAGNPTRILSTKYYGGFTGLGLDVRGYDVSRDGRRFLMIKDPPASGQAASPTSPSMVVVLHWDEELRARIAPNHR